MDAQLQSSLDQLARTHKNYNKCCITGKHLFEIQKIAADNAVFIILETDSEKKHVQDALEGTIYTGVFFEVSREYFTRPNLLAHFPILKKYSNWDILFEKVEKTSFCWQISQQNLFFLRNGQPLLKQFSNIEKTLIPVKANPPDTSTVKGFDAIPTAAEKAKQIVDADRREEQRQLDTFLTLFAQKKMDDPVIVDHPCKLNPNVLNTLLEELVIRRGYQVFYDLIEPAVDRDGCRGPEYHRITVTIPEKEFITLDESKK